MSIQNLLSTRNSRYATQTDPTEILLMALGEIQAELSRLSVNVSVPDIDLSRLENAISQLKPLPPQNLDLNPVFRSQEETTRAIKELLGEIKTSNTRISSIRGGGGGSPDPKHLIDIKRKINDAETRMDYGARTDTNPIYIGRAESGTLSTGTWSIQFLTYDASSRVTRIQQQSGAWDSRASLPWS